MMNGASDDDRNFRCPIGASDDMAGHATRMQRSSKDQSDRSFAGYKYALVSHFSSANKSF